MLGSIEERKEIEGLSSNTSILSDSITSGSSVSASSHSDSSASREESKEDKPSSA